VDSSTVRSFSPSLVAPAGNLEKLKHAVRFGAHEVYFGGESFNLRSQSGNFSPEDMEEGIGFCARHGVKTVFLLNSFVHENDVPAVKSYLREIAHYTFDAVMVSDPGMLMLLKESGSEIPVHLSTQMSTLNHPAVRFWNSLGVSRVVLAREATLDEIRTIRDHTDAALEVFVHGALCISYSGRCLLSRFLSGRDANQGNCSHPCRWRYALVEEKREGAHMEFIEHARGAEILSSRDLCLIGRLKEYAAAGVDAFKIEGRMKSLYYAANTARIYRHALDVIAAGGDPGPHLPFWNAELDLVSHRPYTDDLFNEFDGAGFSPTPYSRKTLFMGYGCEGESGEEIRVKVFNPIREGDALEAIYPIQDNRILDSPCVVEAVMEENEEKNVAMARPGKIYRIKFDRAVFPDAVFRRKIQEP